MKKQILLTIAIPTYNRLDCLKLLLGSLLGQLINNNSLGASIEIFISNNASTDGTTEYLNNLDIDGVRIHHHQINCGGDANIVFCCEASSSKYLWIIGDDDLPMKETIAPLLNLLESQNPDLVYLPTRWESGDLSDCVDIQPEAINLIPVSNGDLAFHANVYVTFISSWIMNMDSYRKYEVPQRYDRFLGSSLSQLEWILTLLSKGSRLFFSKDNWLIARSGNSGNYALFEVFSRNFNDIIEKKFSDDEKIGIFLKKSMLRCFLPGLIWGARNNRAGNFGKFNNEKIFSILSTVYFNSWFFKVLLTPMIRYEIRLANIFRYAARIFSKTWLFVYKKKHNIT